MHTEEVSNQLVRIVGEHVVDLTLIKQTEKEKDVRSSQVLINVVMLRENVTVDVLKSLHFVLILPMPFGPSTEIEMKVVDFAKAAPTIPGKAYSRLLRTTLILEPALGDNNEHAPAFGALLNDAYIGRQEWFEGVAEIQLMNPPFPGERYSLPLGTYNPNQPMSLADAGASIAEFRAKEEAAILEVQADLISQEIPLDGDMTLVLFAP